MGLLKLATARTRMFFLPATGLTVSIQLSKAGAAFANPSAGASNLTEVGSRWYSFTLGAADTSSLGTLAYRLHDGSSVIAPSAGECQDEVVAELPGQLADGAVTDAKVTAPAEAAGRPTTFMGMVRRLWEWQCNKRSRDRSTGVVTLRNDADTAALETQLQVTDGNSDTQTEGS